LYTYNEACIFGRLINFCKVRYNKKERKIRNTFIYGKFRVSSNLKIFKTQNFLKASKLFILLNLLIMIIRTLSFKEKTSPDSFIYIYKRDFDLGIEGAVFNISDSTGLSS